MAKNQGDPAARLAGSIESKIEFVELETDKPIELLSVIIIIANQKPRLGRPIR